MANKVHLSWEQCHSKSIELAEKISARNPVIKGIVAITRGGLVPATIVAHQLGIRKIEVYAVKSYTGSVATKLEVLTLPVEALADKGEGWVVVDELLDSGTTLNYIKEQLPKAYFAAIITKIEGSILDCYVDVYSRDTWIVFPWEND